MSLKTGKLTLIGENGDEIEQLKTSGKVFRIGSSLSCDLILNNSEAKRVHCEIESDSFGRISITNYSKRNPVKINGVTLKGTRPLYTGSVISILDRKIKWINNQRLPRNKMEVDGLHTPVKELRTAEQAPNSEPSAYLHRRDALKRTTIHNFGRNLQLADEEDGDSVRLPEENDDDWTSQDLLTRASIISAAKTFGATPPRSVKRLSLMPKHQKRMDAVTPLKSLKTDKENLSAVRSAKKNVMLLKCQPSGMVVTSYSPSAVMQKNTPKSFVCFVESNPNTPKSDYGTPRSILSELNQDEDDIDGMLEMTPKKTPLSSLRSMHLIDFTTPDVYKTPMPRGVTTPLLKSALKNSTVKTASKATGRNIGIKTPVSHKKPLLSSPASGKTLANQITPIKTDLEKSKTPVRPGTLPNKLNSSSISRSMPRKSVNRLSFSATETPTLLTRRRTLTVASAKSVPGPSKATPILKRKSLFISKPLETPKAIFSATNSRNTRNTPGTPGIHRHSCAKTPTSVQQKFTPAANTPLTGKKPGSILERSRTFILDSPTVLAANKSTVDKDADIGGDSDSEVVPCTQMSESRNAIDANVAVEEEEQNASSSRQSTRSNSFVVNDSKPDNQTAVASDTNLELELTVNDEELALNVSNKSSNKSLRKLNHTFDKESDSDDDDKEEVEKDDSKIADIEVGDSAQKSLQRSPEQKDSDRIKPVDINYEKRRTRNSIRGGSLDVTPNKSTTQKSPESCTLSISAAVSEDCNSCTVSDEPSHVDASVSIASTDETEADDDSVQIVTSQTTQVDSINERSTLTSDESDLELNGSLDKDDEEGEEEEIAVFESIQSHSTRRSGRYSRSRQSTGGANKSTAVMQDLCDEILESNTSLHALSKSEILSISILSCDEGSESVHFMETQLVQEEIVNKSRKSLARKSHSNERSMSFVEDKSMSRPDSANISQSIEGEKDVTDKEPDSQLIAESELNDSTNEQDSNPTSMQDKRKSFRLSRSVKSTNSTVIVDDMLDQSQDISVRSTNILSQSDILSVTVGSSDEANDSTQQKSLSESNESSKSIVLDGSDDLNAVSPKSNLAEADNIKHASRVETYTHSPRLAGVRELLKTPKSVKDINLVGVKELVNTPKCVAGLDNVVGVKEIFNTPNRNELSNLVGVKELVCTPKVNQGLNDPKGMKELFNTPVRDDLSDLFGVKELVNTPAETRGLDDLKGMKELFNTPKSKQGLDDPRGMKEMFNTPARNELSDILGVKELLKTPYESTPELKGVRELMRTPQVLSYEDTDGLSDIFKTPAARSLMVLSTPKSIAVERSNLSSHLLKTPKELNVLEGIEEVGEIFESPISNLIQSLVDESEHLSPEESFDRLTGGKPSNRRTYARTSVTPRVLPIPVAKKPSSDKAQTDIEEWLEGVSSAGENVPIPDHEDRPVKTDSPYPKRIKKPLAASSCIKPSMRLSTRKSNNQEKSLNCNDISGFEELEDSISEISGVFLDSEECNNASETASKVTTSNDQLVQTGPKSVQFVENSPRRRSLKRGPQIDKLKGRISTPHGKKLAGNRSVKISLNNSSSLQFIDESAIDVSDADNSVNNMSRYKIRKSAVGNDISLELIESNNDSSLVLDKSAGKSTLAKDSGFLRKVRRTESGSVISITDEEATPGLDVSESVAHITNESKLRKSLRSNAHQTVEFVDANELSVMSLNTAKMSNTDAFKSILSTTSKTVDCIDEEAMEQTIDISSRATSVYSVSMHESISHVEEEEKLLQLYDEELSQGKETIEQESIEVVYLSEIPDDTCVDDQLKSSMSPLKDALNVSEKRTTRKSRHVANETAHYKSFGESMADASALGKSITEECIAPRNKTLIAHEFSNFTENPAIETRISSKSQTPNINKNAKSNCNHRKTLGSNANTSIPIDLEAEKLKNEFSNFEVKPKSRTVRGLSQLPTDMKRMTVSRRTMGKLPLNPGFDLDAERERRNLSIEFKNFDEDGKVSSLRGRSLSPLKKPKMSAASNRMTIGNKCSNDESFDYEYEVERRNRSLEFANFESEPLTGNRTRGHSEVGVSSDMSSNTDRRLTTGQRSSNTFDHEGELDRRNMSLEFENFKSNEIIDVQSKRRTIYAKDDTTSTKKGRRTMGQQPLNEEFDIETEKERHVLEKEFENFKAESRPTRKRGLSQGPVPVVEKRSNVKKDRRTMGQKPLTEEFDVEEEKERHILEKEFENFDAETRKMRVRGHSQSPANGKEERANVKKDRRTMGQKPLTEEFDVEEEKERHILEKEFENFDAETRKMRIRGHSQSPANGKEERANVKKDRRTMGQKPLTDEFDVEEEKERHILEKEFENFDVETRKIRVRGHSQSPVNGKEERANVKKDRRTMGQKPLTEEFDVEEEKERHILEKEFENFDAETRKMRVRGHSQSPANGKEERANLKKHRRTMGQKPLTKEFDVEEEKERHILEKEFENFDAETRKMRVRGHSQSPANGKDTDELKKDRRTMGQQPLSEGFDPEMEKERYVLEKEFENFDAESRPIRARGQSQSPIHVKDDPKSNKDRRTMGRPPLSDEFDVEIEKERHILEKEFENFEPESKPMRARGQSQSPVNAKDTAKLKNRQTMGHQPLSDEFDIEMEKQRYVLEKEFENFDAESQHKRGRGRSQSPDVKTVDLVDETKRKTMGDRTGSVFNVAEEKEKLVQMRLAEEQKLKSPHSDAEKSVQLEKISEKYETSETPSTKVKNFVVAVDNVSATPPQRGRGRPGRRGQPKPVQIETIIVDSDMKPVSDTPQQEIDQENKRVRRRGKPKVEEPNENKSENETVVELEGANEDAVSISEREALPSRRRGSKPAELKDEKIEHNEEETDSEKIANVSRRRVARNRVPSKSEDDNIQADEAIEPMAEDEEKIGRSTRKGGRKAQPTKQTNDETNKYETIENPTDATENQPPKSKRGGIRGVKHQPESASDQVESMENRSVETTTESIAESKESDPETETDTSGRHVRFGENKYFEISRIDMTDIDSKKGKKPTKKRQTKTSNLANAEKTEMTDDEPVVEFKTPAKSRSRRGAKSAENSDDSVQSSESVKLTTSRLGSRSRRGVTKMELPNEQINLMESDTTTLPTKDEPTESIEKPEKTSEDDQSNDNKKPAAQPRSRRGPAKSVIEDEPTEEKKPAGRSRRGAKGKSEDLPVEKAAAEKVSQDESSESREEKKPMSRSRRGGVKVSQSKKEDVHIEQEDTSDHVQVTSEEPVTMAAMSSEPESEQKEEEQEKPRSRRGRAKAINTNTDGNNEQDQSTNKSDDPSSGEFSETPAKLVVSSRTGRGRRANVIVELSNDESSTPVTKPTRGRGRAKATSKPVEIITHEDTEEAVTQATDNGKEKNGRAKATSKPVEVITHKDTEKAVTQATDNGKEKNLPDERTPAKRSRRLASTATADLEIVSSATKPKPRATRRKQVAEENTNDTSLVSKSEAVEQPTDNEIQEEGQSKIHTADDDNVAPPKARRTRKTPVVEEASTDSPVKSSSRRTNKRKVESTEVVLEEEVKKTRSRRK